MGKVVISGYATMDYVVHAAGRFAGRGTMAMRTPPDGQWPRPGGAVLYAGRQMAAGGHHTCPVTWTGADADGARYRDAITMAGMQPGGVATLPDTVTTQCLMIYDPDGSHGCLLRPGGTELLDTQRNLLAAADLLVLTAGPAEISRALLDCLPETARLAWIVKPDPACFPAELARCIAARADFLFCNGAERSWLDAYRPPDRPDQVLFETRGGDGVTVEADGAALMLAVEPLKVTDPTGAGDSFAGAALAALLDGEDPHSAARRGSDAAASLLRRRA